MSSFRRLFLLAALLPACGGGAAMVQGSHPSLAQLWQQCPHATAAPDAGAATDPNIYTCTYQGSLYEIPVQGTHDIIDVDVDHVPFSDTDYGRQSPYLVVRGLGPGDRITSGGVGPGRAAVGDTALMLFGLATRGNAGGGQSSPASDHPDETSAGASPTAPQYAAHTERIAMAPGLTALVLVRHDERDHLIRIISESELDFLLGVSVSVDFTPLDNRPFGRVILGDPAMTPRSLAFDMDPIYAVSAHALIGLRIQDTAIWLGTPIVSTTGGPFSGIELHIGQRWRSFSQAMYFGLFGALRWGDRPRIAAYTGDDNIDHLPRDWNYAFTFGVELQFDLLTLAGGRDGVVNAFSSN